jgi:hypothetical protein
MTHSEQLRLQELSVLNFLSYDEVKELQGLVVSLFGKPPQMAALLKPKYDYDYDTRGSLAKKALLCDG